MIDYLKMCGFETFDINKVFDKTIKEEICICDDAGLPSAMVPFDILKSNELHSSLPDRTHPAFRVNGREIKRVYISKYLNIVYNGRAYSLKGMKPAAMISFDEAVDACRKKGKGWGLMPASLWAAVALWCMKNKTVPYGNTKFGCSYNEPSYKGEAADDIKSGERVYITRTGSGPAEWNHNYRSDGISDLVGNVFEWQAGLRSVKAELQIIPDADCMAENTSLSADSKSWRAFAADGSLIEPGDDSIKLDFDDGKSAYIYRRTDGLKSVMNTARYCEFKNLRSDIKVPDILRELALFPVYGRESYERDLFYMANKLDEGIAFRGGYFDGDFMAGLFNTGLNMLRSDKTPYIGFRSVYYEL